MEIDTYGKRALTAGELCEFLAKLPPDMPVRIGICDDEFNLQGGVFADAECAATSAEGEIVQISAWVDICAQ